MIRVTSCSARDAQPAAQQRRDSMWSRNPDNREPATFHGPRVAVESDSVESSRVVYDVVTGLGVDAGAVTA